jgi:putative nucleotidyltransferase with HDIG domain
MRITASQTDTTVVPPPNSPSVRFLPYSLVATFVVMILPSLIVTVIAPAGPPVVVLLSVGLAMGASVTLAVLGAALWKRHPGSQDMVFGDLMVWGWLRRVRSERRLAEAHALLGSEGVASGPGMLSSERRCEILQQLAAMLEARDAYTHGHTRRVTRHSERIARELGLPAKQVAKIRIAAALHDVGKVHTPRELLTKRGRLTDPEFEIIKRHPGDGADMVAEVGDSEITSMVRHHHERLDGTGYPDGLAAAEIPLGARIISVADTFDAMTSIRPYRPASKHKRALDVLSKEAGTQLDPAVVAAFMRYYSGKRSVAWSALLITAPHRVAGWAGGLFQAAGGGVTPLAQGVFAAGAAALAGVSLAGPPPPASAHPERAVQHVERQHRVSAPGNARHWYGRQKGVPYAAPGPRDKAENKRKAKNEPGPNPRPDSKRSPRRKPHRGAPTTDAPAKVNAPTTTAPPVTAPKKTKAPKVKAPKKIKAPKAEAPKVKAEKAEKAEPPKL